MVEKVFISPNRVRAYGNILESKTVDDFGLVDSTLTESTDTINNVVQKVFTLEAQTSEITVSLTASSNSIYVGESVLLTATVLEDGVVVEGKTVTFKSGTTSLGTGTTDSNGVATYTLTPGSSGSLSLTASVGSIVSSSVSVAVTAVSVSSISLSSSESTVYVGETILLTASVAWNDGNIYEDTVITFKDGGTTLGTGVTDSNGVATYTITPSSSGSLSLTATGDSVTSGSVSVSVIEHTYSLAFSQATYTASGGSATLECTLLEDNVAKSGATVTVSGSDGSVYNGITNSQGIASVTVSVSAETIFTATYSNVSDTCTVTVQSYLFYDDCTSDRSSEYSDASLQSSTKTGYLPMNYNANGYYTLQATTNEGNHYVKWIDALTGYDNIRVSVEVSTNIINSTNRLGIVIEGDTNYYNERHHIEGNLLRAIFRGTSESTLSTTSLTLSNDTWYRMVYEVQDTSFTFKLVDMNDNILHTTSGTFDSRVITTGATKKYGLYYLNYYSSGQKRYRNIKAEAL